MAHVAVSSISCTPHFKSDADNSWVTKESHVLIHYWFNPAKGGTLLQVAEGIEDWARRDYSEQVRQSPMAGCFGSSYNLVINTMEIRGVAYDRPVMQNYTIQDTLHDEEPFTLRIRASVVGCTIL